MPVRNSRNYFRCRMLEKRRQPAALPACVQSDSRVFPDPFFDSAERDCYDDQWGKFSDQPDDPDCTVQLGERRFYSNPERSISAERSVYSHLGLDRHSAWLHAVQSLRAEAERYAMLGCTWNYVGVWVGLIYQGCVVSEAAEYGIESDATEYIAQVKRDLQDQLWADVLPSLFYAYA